MKKFISMVLVLVLMLGLSVVAFAAPSPTAEEQKTDTTSSLPEYAMSEENTKSGLKLTAWEKKDTELTEEDKAAFEEAKKDAANVTPDGAACQYLFYAQADVWPQDLSVKIENATEVSAKLYADGAWEDLAVSGGNGDIYTIAITGEGPVAIFTK